MYIYLKIIYNVLKSVNFLHINIEFSPFEQRDKKFFFLNVSSTTDIVKCHSVTERGIINDNSIEPDIDLRNYVLISNNFFIIPNIRNFLLFISLFSYFYF